MVLVAFGAVRILFTAHIIHAIINLILVVICLSALYFLQGATFVAMIQLSVYIGGMLVLLVASLLFIKPNLVDTNNLGKKFTYNTIIVGSILAFFVLFIGYLCKQSIQKFILPTPNIIVGTIQELGYQILGTYGLAFELVSIIILTAFVGVVYVIISKVYRQK
ncbi:MAG: hypothetical protein BGO68_00835 [Candidatus Amoebophilus sp. 36-38]|nr:MAG: hypothetical protein BGO68_00835 [Candidatus Amoebophilus sp. 36-38]